MNPLLKHVMAIACVAFMHGCASACAGFIAFLAETLMGQRVLITEILFYAFWFPYAIFDYFHVAPTYDTANAYVVNSLSWTVVMYPMWLVSKPMRTRVVKFLHSRRVQAPVVLQK